MQNALMHALLVPPIQCAGSTSTEHVEVDKVGEGNKYKRDPTKETLTPTECHSELIAAQLRLLQYPTAATPDAGQQVGCHKAMFYTVTGYHS